MADDMYDEAIIDVVGPNTIISAPYTIKDLYLGNISTRQLNFSSPFTLVSRADRRTKVTAFVLYFDAFFTKTGKPVSPSTQVKVVKEDEAVLAEVWPVGGKPPPQRRPSQGADREKVTSFSTGPQSIPTHWKQTLFLLREPIVVEEGPSFLRFKCLADPRVPQVPRSEEPSIVARAKVTLGSWKSRFTM